MINTYSDIVENALFYEQRTTIFTSLGTNVLLCRADINRRFLRIVFAPNGAVAIPNFVFCNGNERQAWRLANTAFEENISWYDVGNLVCQSFHIQSTSGSGVLVVYESVLNPRSNRSTPNDYGILKTLAAKIKGVIPGENRRGSTGINYCSGKYPKA